MIVMKFGGSSVESARAIQRVVSIVHHQSKGHDQSTDRNGHPPVVVVSAMGKTTDQLLNIARLSVSGNQSATDRELARLRRFHQTEAASLTRGMHGAWLDARLCDLFVELAEILDGLTQSDSLAPSDSDAVLSFGERLSSVMVTAGFRQMGIDAFHLDARTVIVTDDAHGGAAPLFIETNALLRRRISGQKVTVMGGFIGATQEGVPTTLGRGGSDYTAAIVGAAIDADEIQIWTDVDGMLSCDPRLVPGAHCLKSISYVEAEQMAKAGARVLHPATVLPAIRLRIPIVIRNSRNPNAAGTRIVRDSPCEGTAMSIACRSSVAVLQVIPRNTPVTDDFGSRMWNAFQQAGVQFDLIAATSREISMLVEASSLTAEFLSRLEAVADIDVQERRALVTVIGNNVLRNSTNLARASQRLRGIAGGAVLAWCSDSRFAFILAEDAVIAATAALHDEFFGEPDPAFFIPNRTSLLTRDSVASQSEAKCRSGMLNAFAHSRG